MDRFLLGIFQREIAFQCKVVISSEYELQAALTTRSTDEIWKQLQIILTASANLSKMLWGSGGGKEDERAPLRESLQVGEDSPIRDVDLRNDFEHFDERLESWFAESESCIYMGRNIGRPHQMLPGHDPGDRFQHFDPTTGQVTFWAHTVWLRDLTDEARRIFPLAESEASKPG